MFQPAESADELGLFCSKAIRQSLNLVVEQRVLVFASVLKVSMSMHLLRTFQLHFTLKKDKFHGSYVKKFVVQKSFGNQKIDNVEMIDNTRNQSQLEKSLSNLHSHMLCSFLFKPHSIFPRQRFPSFPVSNFPLLMDQCCRYIHIINGP